MRCVVAYRTGWEGRAGPDVPVSRGSEGYRRADSDATSRSGFEAAMGSPWL
jgi:hypothetical protein